MANDPNGKLHEMSFHVQVSATTNVNSVGPEFIMAWLLHNADKSGPRDARNRQKFLNAAREIASIYSYMPMAERVNAAQDTPA